MPFVHHKFGKTYYKTTTKHKNKPKLVVLHGGPGSTHLALEFLLTAKLPFDVLVYDQIGAGKSSRIDKKYWRFSTFLYELKALRQHLQLDEVHLMGVSWGTTLAIEHYLKTKGEGIMSLVLQSPMLSAKDWAADAKRLIKTLPKKHQMAIYHCSKVGAYDSTVFQEASLEFTKRFVCRGDLESPLIKAVKKQFNEELYNHMWGPTEFEPLGSLSQFSRTRDLGRITCPSLLMCGTHDEATPKTSKKYVKKMKKARFVELKGCSHFASYEDPKQYVSKLSSFLTSLDGRALS
ncbi:MAG: prolyl aminopeptidase [Bdellovibrionaceae bacterium]|nr:prolyl aminopeptidase [Pseudobdellovibrionaceae bacterium]